MKFIQKYQNFSNDRPLKEEFISKLVRNISGENKERIQEIKSLCDEFSSLYFDVVETGDFGDVDKELKEKEFTEIWNLLLRKTALVPGLSGGEEGLNFIENIISILKKGKDHMSVSAGKRLDTELDFIKSLDKAPYLKFKDTLKKLVDKIKNEKSTIVVSAFIKNLEKIVEQKSKALSEAKRILSILKSKETFFYYSGLNLDKESGSLKLNGSWYESYVARFVKSLVLKLTKNKKGEETKVCDRNLDGYGGYSINSVYNWSYDDEFGVDYFDKKIGSETLDKKVGELENFKKLIAEIEEIKPILKEFYDKLDFLKQSIERLKSSPPKFVYDRDISKYLDYTLRTEGLTRELEKNLKSSLESLQDDLQENYHSFHRPAILRAEFVYTDYQNIFCFREGKDQTAFFFPLDLIKLIEDFKRSYESKTVKEILNAGKEKFEKMDTLVVTQSDSPNTWREGDTLNCGNILYHGSIHYRLDQPGEIEKLIYKRGRYETRYAGKGVYCTVYPSAACQYQYLRGTTGGIMNQLPDSIRKQFLVPNSDYFPCIYKFTLKSGSKFEFKSDTTMEDEEFYNLQKLGLQGIHSGWNEVIGGQTQETCIIDPECILKVEKLKPSEILDIDDNLWRRGSKLEKETFIKWYKDLISKRKDN